MEQIIAKLRAGEELTAAEVEAVWNEYEYDSDIYEILRHGDVAYIGIVKIADDEFYQISYVGNDMWGYECDGGVCPRVALKQVTRYEWRPVEED